MKLKGRVTCAEDLLNLDRLQEALEVRALIGILDIVKAMAQSTEKDADVKENELFA
jgi:hypothetical protein